MSGSRRYRVTTLAGVPFATIHACFSAAFADYAVKAVAMTEALLLRRANKNAWAPELSAGIWFEDQLVAVSLTGVDREGGEQRAYDICTGIVPDHRGCGLAGQMLAAMLEGLRAEGVEAMQLEVLQQNRAGIRAYEKAGFQRTRGLVVCAAAAGEAKRLGRHDAVRKMDAASLFQLSDQLAFEPSFEQRDQAIRTLSDELVYLGAFANEQCVAALAYDPQTDWLMRLVTHRNHRRQGYAAGLLSALAQSLPAETMIRAVNIDDRDLATQAVLQRQGFEEAIRQWEMRLEL